MCAAPKGDNLWAKQTEQSSVCKRGSGNSKKQTSKQKKTGHVELPR